MCAPIQKFHPKSQRYAQRERKTTQKISSNWTLIQLLMLPLCYNNTLKYGPCDWSLESRKVVQILIFHRVNVLLSHFFPVTQMSLLIFEKDMTVVREHGIWIINAYLRDEWIWALNWLWHFDRTTNSIAYFDWQCINKNQWDIIPFGRGRKNASLTSKWNLYHRYIFREYENKTNKSRFSIE